MYTCVCEWAEGEGEGERKKALLENRPLTHPSSSSLTIGSSIPM